MVAVIAEGRVPSISVIIPVHNGGRHLPLCLAALRQSTVPPLECIVVDDGSTDGSMAAARAWGARTLETGGRNGSYIARNLGASQAQGELLLFLDADVCVQPDTLARVADAFREDPSLDALIGSYDDAPGGPDLLSQYRNLLHHFVHQQGQRRASTFWTGCGAIRREVFQSMDGFFGPQRFFGDVAFGYLLAHAGRKIVLEKTLTVKHLKRWRLGEMVRTDIFRRGALWTQLILRYRHMPDDLNLRIGQRWSVVLIFLGLGALLAGALFRPPAAWWLLPAALAVAYLLLNRPFLAFLARRRGRWFALRALPFSAVYHLCCGLGFLVGVLRYARSKLLPPA